VRENEKTDTVFYFKQISATMSGQGVEALGKVYRAWPKQNLVRIGAPLARWQKAPLFKEIMKEVMVDDPGIEPGTLCLRGRCSNLLS
jgi:hypothetical protein